MRQGFYPTTGCDCADERRSCYYSIHRADLWRRFPYAVYFQPAAIRACYGVIEEIVKANPILAGVSTDKPPKVSLSNLVVHRGGDQTSHDDEEQFFADYLRQPEYATYYKYIGGCCLHLTLYERATEVSVECPSRSAIDAVLKPF